MKNTILTALLLFAAAAVFAQSEYNFQRRSLFEKLPVTSKDIVFLGNSITDGGEWNELLANPRVKNRGISGDRSSWMLDRLDPIVGGQPRKLFLLIGTNDLAAGVSPDEIVANVARLIDRFQSESRTSARSWSASRANRPARNSMCRASFRSTTRSRNTLPNTAVTTPTSWP